jgi:hypothetical protein
MFDFIPFSRTLRLEGGCRLESGPVKSSSACQACPVHICVRVPQMAIDSLMLISWPPRGGTVPEQRKPVVHDQPAFPRLVVYLVDSIRTFVRL